MRKVRKRKFRFRFRNTDATIAYSVCGILEVIDAPTLIVNRELAVWYREAESALAVDSGTYIRRSVPDEVNA